MRLQYIPLLQTQRELYELPRDYARFKRYLRVMINDRGDDLDLPPLVAMNPMAREHVTAVLDEYLALDADKIAADALAEVVDELPVDDVEYELSLVIMDDYKGGWTNRFAYEFGFRCGNPVRFGAKAQQRDRWLTAPLWSSEPATAAGVRQSVLMTGRRMAYRRQHGPSRTLRQMLAQEGYVMACAGCIAPTLDEDDLGYTRQVIEPWLSSEAVPTCMACLFGDVGAKSLGFTPLGLSDRAGLALALADATSATRSALS